MGLEDDTKGILLYGPPGTGKTLIASKIASILNVPRRNYRVVNGPELLSKYVGEAEERMRQLFLPAEQNPKQMFVLFFDEFDALARSRSGGEGAGQRVGDNIVNQLLSKMDGAEKIPNILVIGATNRLDIIDEALLRPGRFSVQLAIGLPDEAGRRDIFQIHLRKIAPGVMQDIDLDLLARHSKNFTGAEIKHCCHEARLFALLDAAEDPKDITSVDETKLRLTMDHFHAAFAKVVPHMGRDTSSISTGLPARPYALPSQQQLVNTVAQRIKSFRPGRVSSLLLRGESGSGKSAIVGQCVDRLQGQFDTVRILSASPFSKSFTEQLAVSWDTCKAVQRALIVLDGLEHLLEMINEHRFNENAMKKLNMLLAATTTSPSQTVVVVATINTTAAQLFKLANPTAQWSAAYSVSELSEDDVHIILQASGVPHPKLKSHFANKPIAKVLDILHSTDKASSLDDWLEALNMFFLDDLQL